MESEGLRSFNTRLNADCRGRVQPHPVQFLSRLLRSFFQFLFQREMRGGVRTKSQPPTNFETKDQRVAIDYRFTECSSRPLYETIITGGLLSLSLARWKQSAMEGKYIDIEIRIDIVDVT